MADRIDRRKLFGRGMWGAMLAGIGGAAGYLLGKGNDVEMLWQIDPDKCISCGNCATFCVLEESAVKCVQAYDICGYCDLCTGYLEPGAIDRDTGAVRELCPTGAIERNFIEDPYYEYNIIEDKCIGCAKCVEGCEIFGNGSLFLQVRHDRCLNCNECSIAVACPSEAFKRVKVEDAYVLRGGGE